MSPSLRFLGLALFAWAGVRAASLGLVPGVRVSTAEPAWPEPKPLPAARSDLVVPLSLPPFPPLLVPAAAPTPPAPPLPVPRWVAGPAQDRFEPPDEPSEAQPDPPWGAPARGAGSAPTFSPPLEPARERPDRVQLSAWAMFRKLPGPPSLASAGTLGGSQAGARLLWRFDRHLAASLRFSSPVENARGGEAAFGLRYQPVRSIPVAVTLERRQAFGEGGGVSGFAAFAEAGLYRRPARFGLQLDAYVQSGMVGARHRTWFADASAVVTRPLWRNISAGAGIWGGAQPGLARLDAGPRLSVQLRPGIRAHADYRRKLAGNAEPGSGGVVTLAADF